MANENTVTLSREEYEKMLEMQQQMFQEVRNMRSEMKEMQKQMDMFSLHFGQMYAAQSIEETLLTMGELGKTEIGAERCTVYSVDPFDQTKMFTANRNGEREYFSPSDESFFTQAIQNKESLILEGEDGETLLFVPLENQSGEIIGLATAQGKEGGFTKDDIDAFSLQGGKVGNAFRLGLENKSLYQKATTDKLTGLQNREGMEDFIKSHALSHLNRDNDVSVIMLDIDHFKNFNDTYGHDVGDKCLKQVADTLQENTRKTADNGVFRWGGEEMVVIVPTNGERASEIADRLRKAIEDKPFIVDANTKTQITISGGVASFDKNIFGYDSNTIMNAFENTLEEADKALYQAKENGRNQIQFSGHQAKEMQAQKESDEIFPAPPEAKSYDEVRTECENLLNAVGLKADEVYESIFNDIADEEYKASENSDLTEMSAFYKGVRTQAAKQYINDELPNLNAEVWVEANGQSHFSITNGAGETVEYNGQTMDELIYAFNKKDLLVTDVDEYAKTITAIPTNDFLMKLNDSFKDSPFSISDYVEEMVGSSSRELSVQMTNEGKMNVLLDFTEGQGVMEIQDEKLSDSIKESLVTQMSPQVREASVEFLQELTDYAKKYDNILEAKEGEQIVNVKDLAYFENISKYSSEIARQEYLLAQDIMRYVHDYSVDSINPDYLYSEFAETLEDPKDLKETIRTLDKYAVVASDRQSDVDKAVEAGDLMERVAKLQQAQLEELRGRQFTDKECLDITVSRSIYDYDVPFVQFGKYCATSELTYSPEQTEDYFKSLLREDDTPVALLTVDRGSKSALLEFMSNDINTEDVIRIVNAYEEPMQAADFSVTYPENFEELDFLDIDPAEDVVKDGDTYRIRFPEADEEEIMNRVGLVTDSGNLDIYIENNAIYVDFVDGSRETAEVPLSFLERNALKEMIEEYSKGKELTQEAAYTLPDGMYEMIKEMPAGAKVHLDEFLDNVVLEVTKDSDFTKGIIMETVLEDEYNMVNVDFSVNGKSIASTTDIHVADLENVLDEIRNGNTSYLIDEDKPLSELAAKANADAEKRKHKPDIAKD